MRDRYLRLVLAVMAWMLVPGTSARALDLTPARAAATASENAPRVARDRTSRDEDVDAPHIHALASTSGTVANASSSTTIDDAIAFAEEHRPARRGSPAQPRGPPR